MDQVSIFKLQLKVGCFQGITWLVFPLQEKQTTSAPARKQKTSAPTSSWPANVHLFSVSHYL